LLFIRRSESPIRLYREYDSIVRFPYQNGDLKARGPAQTVVASIPGGNKYGGGHWTRSLVFSNDGKKLYVGVGSRANVADDEAETNRADVLEFNPDGTGQRIYASGIRNASGITMHPKTGQLWAAVNERDALGDDLVPDYVTPRPGRRLLRLALVLHGAKPGSAVRRQAFLN